MPRALSFKWSKPQRRSLFMQLLASFLVIIVLLLSFHMLSFAFFRSLMQDEIIRYNKADLQHAVDNYERQIGMLTTSMLNLYMDDAVSSFALNVDRIRYDIADHIRIQLKKMSASFYPYVDNIAITYHEPKLVIEKDGINTPQQMYGKFYASSDYSPSFWMAQFNRSEATRLFPAREFSENNVSQTLRKGNLMPLIVKNKLQRHFYASAFLDADAFLRAYQPPVSDGFGILSPDAGSLLFGTADHFDTEQVMAAYRKNQGYVTSGDSFFFYLKGAATGSIYVNVISASSLSAQLAKLNWMLAGILALVLVIGLTASVWFSMRIHQPIRSLLRTIQLKRADALKYKGIMELEEIGSNVQQLLESNQSLNRDLIRKNSLLRHYFYTNKLKMIHTRNADFQELLQEERPYRLALFKLHRKQSLDWTSEASTGRAAYFVMEFIQSSLSAKYEEALVFQMERDQIVALIMLREGEEAPEEAARALKQVFDHDKQYLFFTIAISSAYASSAEFNTAYEETLCMARQRLFHEDTELILASLPQDKISMTGQEEQQLNAVLVSGNEDAVKSWLDKILRRFHDRRATAEDIQRFTDDCCHAAYKCLSAHNLPTEAVKAKFTDWDPIKRGYHVDRMRNYLLAFLYDAAAQIAQSVQEEDAVTKFVKQYIEEHFGENISLDSIADELKLTSGYVSSYFKEKTGMKFSQYVNDVRIRQAKRLLRQPDLKILDVAARVGYHNVNSFIRMFKNTTGLSPGEYRKKIDAMPD
ncbi:helix-turn-helix domain-containing protein [Paenibacillus apiarius]|uniref:helix-turn-helix domain-containing protein n=1 Tax=Paenibacillus apiarius TaxID=46240 RepID=UPI0019808F27|nr:AraC family transcriptional regulator [Paenibacillus apiarius]MBN3526316.1 helix-turn-helix transcriptional regulator [Paenibacillus apiarius]